MSVGQSSSCQSSCLFLPECQRGWGQHSALVLCACHTVPLPPSDCATSSLCVGGAAGGGYAQVIPMEEVNASFVKTHTLKG